MLDLSYIREHADEVADALEKRGMELTLDPILELDRDGFDRYVVETGATICGRVAIDVLLGMLQPATRAELVAYDTSGRMTGDWNHSVSYASIAFFDSSAASAA